MTTQRVSKAIKINEKNFLELKFFFFCDTATRKSSYAWRSKDFKERVYGS